MLLLNFAKAMLVISVATATTFMKEMPSVKHLHDVETFSLREIRPSSHPNAPHGDLMHLSFKAFGKLFDHDLHLDEGIWHDDATLTFYDGGKAVKSVKPAIRSYTTLPNVVPRVSAYVVDESTVHAMIVTSDDVYTLCSVDHDTNTKAKKMVIYKESELEDSHPHEEKMIQLLKQAKPEQAAPSARKLMQDPNDPKHTGVTKWDDCWTGQANPKTMTVGLAVDAGYYSRFASAADPDAELERDLAEIIAYSNLIFGQQMNVYLRFSGDLKIYKSVSAGDPVWNRKQPCGANSASETLNEFRSWKTKNEQNSAGVWHLLTDCFPPPGTVGIAYVGVLCSKSYGVGLTTYMNQRGRKGTWKTFAHEIGHNFDASHSFENGQGRTGGIMDYGDGLYKGIYQFHDLRKKQVCQHVDSSMRSTRGSTTCWINGDGKNVSSINTYKWEISTDTYGCSVPCGPGVEVSKVYCINEEASMRVADTFCDPRKPPGTEVFCNLKACDVTTCATYCGAGCPSTAGCVGDAFRKDAGFKVPRGKYTYIFRGEDVTRFTDENVTADAGWPRKINNTFPTLDEDFQSDLDAAVVREDGDIYFFKGSNFVRYSMGTGQHNGYPKTIASTFLGLNFTSDIDAAMSFKGGAFFFKGDKFQEYLDNQRASASKEVRAIGQLGITFRDGVDAAVFDWGTKVRMYRNGKQLLYKVGLGEIEAPQPVTSIGEPGVAIICPSNCFDCLDASTCVQCIDDYKLSKAKPGTCIPFIYAMDLPFDDLNYDKTQFVSHNVLDSAWDVSGNTGGGINLTTNNYLNLKPIPEVFPDFSYHTWVNLKNMNQDMRLVSMEFSNGVVATWDLIKDAVEDRGLLSKFTLGSSVIVGNTPVVPDSWKHIHADLVEGNLRVSVDAVEVRVPYDGEEKSWQIKSWSIGSKVHANGTNLNNGLNALLDAFHIDLLEVEPPIPPTPDDIGLAVGMSFFCAATVIGVSFYYCAYFRPGRSSDGKTCMRDGIFSSILAVIMFCFIGITALAAHGDIQIAFILPMCVCFAAALGFLAFKVHRNDMKWLWPAEGGDLGKMKGVAA